MHHIPPNTDLATGDRDAPSNSSPFLPDFDHSELSGFGVDWSTLTAPVALLRPEESLERRRWLAPYSDSFAEHGAADVDLGFTRGSLGIWRSGERHRMKLSFNPRHFVYEQLCPVGALVPAVEAALRAIDDDLRLTCSLEDMKVERVDLARDFTKVGNPATYILAIAMYPARYARRCDLYASKGASSVETVYRGGRESFVRLYDKSAEDPEYTPPGTLRFELQAGPGLLKRKGVVTLSAAMRFSS